MIESFIISLGLACTSILLFKTEKSLTYNIFPTLMLCIGTWGVIIISFMSLFIL